MKKLVRKDKNKRNLVFSSEIKRFVLKNIIQNNSFSIIVKWKAKLNLLENFKNSFLIRIVNRCVFTGRKKRINKLYSFSRIIFLKLSRSGYINGLKKSSW
jgi:ribosomal protein S14